MDIDQCDYSFVSGFGCGFVVGVGVGVGVAFAESTLSCLARSESKLAPKVGPFGFSSDSPNLKILLSSISTPSDAFGTPPAAVSAGARSSAVTSPFVPQFGHAIITGRCGVVTVIKPPHL